MTLLQMKSVQAAFSELSIHQCHIGGAGKCCNKSQDSVSYASMTTVPESKRTSASPSWSHALLRNHVFPLAYFKTQVSYYDAMYLVYCHNTSGVR